MLAGAVKMDDWLFVDDIDVPLRQRALFHKIDQDCYDSFIATAPDTGSRPLAGSTAICHADDWSSVVPLMALGLHFHCQKFRLSLKYWLDLRIMDSEYRCPF